jgi:acetylornithine deacetylase/succinyl-diaminopimelate desuccinylase-like protein
MKGFVASMLSAASKASGQKLRTPLHLGLSYDEEVGCIGVHSMIDMLSSYSASTFGVHCGRTYGACGDYRP